MKYISFFLLFLTIFTSYCTQDMLPETKISYRPPQVAGSFYPSDADSLRRTIERYLAQAEPKLVESEVIALVVPHAGYVYSGRVAAEAYRQVQGKKFDAVVIISPSHQKMFYGSSVFSGDAYVTPLGVANVDHELANEICSYDSSVKRSMDGHGWRDSNSEHSLEVQIPFLQVVLPDVPIVPICMGTQDFQTVDALMRSIVNASRKFSKKVLLVASSDLSHFHSADAAKKLDMQIVKGFTAFNYFQLAYQLFSGKLEACGGGPIVTVMMAAEQLGGTNAYSIDYKNSSDSPETPSSKDRVVGYLAGAIVKGDSDNLDLLPSLNDKDKEQILEAAKAGVIAAVKGEKKSSKMHLVTPNLSGMFGCFVTLKIDGDLRACIGHTIPTKNIILEIEEVAGLSATSDYRFGAVSESELDDLQYEVTILSRMKRILEPEDVQVGKDGLLIRMGNSSGLLLPQVPIEHNMNQKTYLEQICAKAGLPKDSYKRPEAELYIFRAVIVH